jgi:hypothetical protein
MFFFGGFAGKQKASAMQDGTRSGEPARKTQRSFHADTVLGTTTAAAEQERLNSLQIQFNEDGRVVKDAKETYQNMNFSTRSFQVLEENTASAALKGILDLVAEGEQDGAAEVDASFWLPAEARPCSLHEVLAQEIFRLHTAGSTFDPSTSGAEWWFVVREPRVDGSAKLSPPSPPPQEDDGGGGPLATVDVTAGQAEQNAARNGKASDGEASTVEEDDDGDEDDEDDDGDDDVVAHDGGDAGIDFHFDKDVMLASLGLPFVHPTLSTVTYLTSCNGAPTVVFPLRRSPQGELDRSCKCMAVSHPVAGKHLVFDGKLLHGCPESLATKSSSSSSSPPLPSCAVAEAAAAAAATSPAGVSPSCSSPPPVTTTTSATTKELVHDTSKAQPPPPRVTLLVNIWLNHAPFGVQRFPFTDFPSSLASMPSEQDTAQIRQFLCREAGGLSGATTATAATATATAAAAAAAAAAASDADRGPKGNIAKEQTNSCEGRFACGVHSDGGGSDKKSTDAPSSSFASAEWDLRVTVDGQARSEADNLKLRVPNMPTSEHCAAQCAAGVSTFHLEFKAGNGPTIAPWSEDPPNPSKRQRHLK